MLWDIIRDFFVQYIFGGCTSNEVFYGGFIGYLYDGDILNNDFAFADNAFIKVSLVADYNSTGLYDYITVGDWLSTTATIIVMCLIIWFFIRLVIYFFRQGANLIKW